MNNFSQISITKSKLTQSFVAIFFGFAIGIFLSPNPASRIVYLLGALFYGILILQYPEIFVGIFIGGLFGLSLKFTPRLDAIHGWSLLTVGVALFHKLRTKDTEFISNFGNGLVFSQILFAILLWAGLYYTPFFDTGRTIAWHFLYWNLAPFFLIILFANDSQRLERLFWSFILSLAVFSLTGFYGYLTGNEFWMGQAAERTSSSISSIGTEKRFYILFLDPISYSRICAISTISFFYFAMRMKSSLQRICLTVLSGAFLFTMILTGTRGTFVAFTVSALVLVLLTMRRNAIKGALSLALLVGVIILSFNVINPAYIERYFFYSTGVGMHPVQARIFFAKVAIHKFLVSPIIGNGTGSFNIWGIYPHNIFLEIASSWGLIGILLFGFFIFKTMAVGLKSISNELTLKTQKQIMPLLLAGFIFYLVSAQFSSNINGNQFIWIFSGLIWAFSCSNRVTLDSNG